MRNLGQLMMINLKLSVKQVAKKSPNTNKCDPSEWDALPWEGVEKKLTTNQAIRAYHACGELCFPAKTRPHFRN
jgi:hypothetical protein